jgi:hypothetical protein
MDSTVARELPFIDEHSIEVNAPSERVWKALRERAPRTGFPSRREEAGRALVLEGRHPFSRYRLGFHLDRLGPERTRVRARTEAAFPGPHGTVYRALVIGTRMHVLAVGRMLRQLKRAAERT